VKKHVTIWTDGSCFGNPGPGGWAAILRYQDVELIISGFEPRATNNKMELMAAIRGLSALKGKSRLVDLYTDSEYVKNGIELWLKAWIARNWRGSKGQQVKNKELWKRLQSVAAKHVVSWHWVRGHAGEKMNERVDQLARTAITMRRGVQLRRSISDDQIQWDF
jgi:ribonuclease HI